MVRTRKVYTGGTLTRVLFPVAICMILVAVNAKVLNLRYTETNNPKLILGIFYSYQSEEKLLYTLIVFVFLTSATTFGVVCYKYKLYKVIKAYLFLNSFILFFLVFPFNLLQLMEVLNITTSIIPVLFVCFNFGCLGLISIHWKASKRMNQFYMVMIAALTAILIIYFVPDWTVWITLFCMSVWDLIAVLAPFGPLQSLLKISRRRGDESFPAVLYSSMSYPYDTPNTIRSNMTEETEMTEFMSSTSTPASMTRRRQPIRLVEGNIRLGLGDFVFYSLMLGNVVQTSSISTAISCFISNLAGLIITLPIVTLTQMAVPALPFPLLFAALFYFPAHIAVIPFTDYFSNNIILL